MNKLSKEFLLKLLGFSVMFFLVILVAEGGAFLTLKMLSPTVTGVRDYKAHSHDSGLHSDVDVSTYQSEGQAAYNAPVFDFYRAFRPVGPLSGQYVSTDEKGFRKTVEAVKAIPDLKDIHIGFFGGSTMWGAGAAGDKNTIPSLFSTVVNQNINTAYFRVFNYGVGGYHSGQELIALLEVLENRPIDIVIFYDGVNDAIMGYRELLKGNTRQPFMQPSLPQAKLAASLWVTANGDACIENQDELYARLFALGRAYQGLNIVKLYHTMSRFFSESYVPAQDPGSSNKHEPKKHLSKSEEKQVRRIVSLYGKNMRIIRALGKEYGFKPFFFLQPMLFTKKALSRYEKRSPYSDDVRSVRFQLAVYKALKDAYNADSDYFDLTDIMKTDETIYFDDHHTSKKGNSIISIEIFGRIEPYLRSL